VFDVGFTEILLIGIVSLVVIGPERLPTVARTAGQWIGKLQRFVKGVKTDLASELESGDLKKLIGDQREQINELRDMVSSAQKDLQSTTQSVVKSTREGLSELETTIDKAKSDDSVENAEDVNDDYHRNTADELEHDSVSLTKRTGTTDSDKP